MVFSHGRNLKAPEFDNSPRFGESKALDSTPLKLLDVTCLSQEGVKLFRRVAGLPKTNCTRIYYILFVTKLRPEQSVTQQF